MADYQAKAITLSSFELRQGDKLIGKLLYESWFKFSARIEIAQKNYQAEPKGFWGTTIEVKDNDTISLSFKMNWNGEIIIQTDVRDASKGFIFKHRGIFKESYVLLEHEGLELLVMKPHVKWKKMSYEYQINTTEDFDKFPNKELLLITSIHCANYYLSMMTTG